MQLELQELYIWQKIMEVQCDVLAKKIISVLGMLAFKQFFGFDSLGTKNFWAFATLYVIYKFLVAVQNEEDKERILSVIQNQAGVF